MTEPQPRSASEADAQAVAAVITLAFASDPMARWSMPDVQRYFAEMPSVVRAFGGNGYAHVSIDVVDPGRGAAMWLPPGETPDVAALVGLFETHAPADRLPDIMAVFEAVDAYHPKEPHWYLPLIGIDPVWQGRGIGSALMRHALARADADGLPAYLESSHPRNVPFYEHFGFEALGSIQVGSSPTMVPMLRRPR